MPFESRWGMRQESGGLTEEEPENCVGSTRKASGGNRTHNPRITNAVLCQLKLRWRETSDEQKSHRRTPQRSAEQRGSSSGSPRVGLPEGLLFPERKEKSGVSTRQERPVEAERIRGKATARPKKPKTPLFSGVGDRNRSPCPGERGCTSRAKTGRVRKRASIASGRRRLPRGELLEIVPDSVPGGTCGGGFRHWETGGLKMR